MKANKSVYWMWAAILLAIGGCQRLQNSSSGNGKPLPLIKSADHKLYIGECVKQVGFSSMDECEYSPPGAGGTSGARGAVVVAGSSTANITFNTSYDNYYNQYGSYYYYYLYYYNQANFCQTYGWDPSCAQSFGYDQYYFNGNSNYCDFCLRSPSSTGCSSQCYITLPTASTTTMTQPTIPSIPIPQPNPLPITPTSPSTPTTPSQPTVISAWCVGGPVMPSYSFRSYGDALACGRRVGSASNSCNEDVRVRACHAFVSMVDTVNAGNCRCAPGTPAVGSW